MKIHFFSVNALEPAEDQVAIDDFCSRHRVVAIDKKLLENVQIPYWAVSVTYLEASASLKKSEYPVNKKSQIDYQVVLKPSDFALYTKLRTLRKEISDSEKVPAFALFTNAQLADMVTSKVTTRRALGKIDGIGEAKLEKYAEPFLGVLTTELITSAQESEEVGHEENENRAG